MSRLCVNRKMIKKCVILRKLSSSFFPKVSSVYSYMYWGADKSLARPGRKQATATEDFGFRLSYL